MLGVCIGSASTVGVCCLLLVILTAWRAKRQSAVQGPGTTGRGPGTTGIPPVYEEIDANYEQKNMMSYIHNEAYNNVTVNVE